MAAETWTVTQAMLRTLEGLHHRVVRQITGAVAYRVNDEWIYPTIAGALEEAGLFPIATYLERLQNRIAEKISTRPILGLCTQAEGPGGSRQHKWWNRPPLAPEESPVEHPSMAEEEAQQLADEEEQG